jgi:hypothetical protein
MGSFSSATALGQRSVCRQTVRRQNRASPVRHRAPAARGLT